MASLVAAKDKVFITQTKLLHEVTWKTVMQIAKKYAKNPVMYLQRLCDSQKCERIFIDWCWWILGALPFPHLGESNTLLNEFCLFFAHSSSCHGLLLQ